MKQQIILAPNLSGTDYLKSLAVFNKTNINTFGVRVMNSLELTRYMLQTSGIVVLKDFVPDNKLAACLYNKTKEIPYFSKYTFTDVYNLLKSVNNLRRCIPFNEAEEIERLPTDQFKEKNDAVKAFYKLLINTLEENNEIDEVGLIRTSIEKCKPLSNVDFVRYEEISLTKLDEALLNKAAGKVVEPVKFDDGSKLNICTYTKSYGQINEIDNILHYIYEHGIKFDECLIAATDVTEYAKILANYQGLAGFPLIIGNSQSIMDTTPGRLFSALLEWEKNHFHKDYLTQIIWSSDFNLAKFKEDIGLVGDFEDFVPNQELPYFERLSFDLIVEFVGNLGIGFSNKTSNDERFKALNTLVNQKYQENSSDPFNLRDKEILVYVERIKDIFERGIQYLLNQYVVIDPENVAVEGNALSSINQILLLSKEHNIDFDEAVRFLETIKVGSRKPKPGSLYITSITSALSYLRKHIFVVGLDSKLFPGGVKEDPIIFDRDYKVYGIDNASSKAMEDKKKAYHALISFAKTVGAEIHLSYTYANTETLKDQSASSVLFETYVKEHEGEEVTVAMLNKEFDNKESNKFKSVEFFDGHLFLSSCIGKEAKNNTKLIKDEIDPTNIGDVDGSSMLGRKGLSASAVKNFTECEYKFLLANLLNVEQEKETDIYELIPANDFGTILHAVMEEYYPGINKQDFLRIGEKAFTEYFIYHPTDNKPGAKRELEEFLETLSTAYDMEAKDNLPAELREEDVVAFHKKSGLKIHGLPDKVEKFGNGHYRVVDFKTGRSVKHDPNDADSMLQGALYTYVLENSKNALTKNGNKVIVDEFVFRYPRVNKYVSSCENGHSVQEYVDRLGEVLQKIKQAITTGKFEKNGKCDGCYFKSVCGGKKQ